MTAYAPVVLFRHGQARQTTSALDETALRAKGWRNHERFGDEVPAEQVAAPPADATAAAVALKQDASTAATDAELAAALSSLSGTLLTTANSGASYALAAPAHGTSAYKLTLTANVTFSVSGGTAAEECTIDLYMIQDGTGSRSVTWPSDISWGASGAPVLSTTAGRMDVVTLVTIDGGTTFFGFLATTGITVPTVPAQVTGLSVTPGNTTNTLTWSAASDGGATITGYKVYRSTTSGAETLLTTLGDVLTYSDTSLTNGTTYYYKVAAMNGLGDGSQSAEASGTPVAALVQDTFTAADTTTGLLGRSTPVGSKVWTRTGGTGAWGITSGKAYQSDNSGSGVGLYVDAATADCTVQVDYTMGASITGSVGVLLRWTDNNNYLQLIPDPSGWYIQQITGGVQSNLNHAGTPATSTTYTLKVAMSGTGLTVFVDGVQIFTATTVVTSGTKHGLMSQIGGGTHTVRWDNFLVT